VLVNIIWSSRRESHDNRWSAAYKRVYRTSISYGVSSMHTRIMSLSRWCLRQLRSFGALRPHSVIYVNLSHYVISSTSLARRSRPIWRWRSRRRRFISATIDSSCCSRRSFSSSVPAAISSLFSITNRRLCINLSLWCVAS